MSSELDKALAQLERAIAALTVYGDAEAAVAPLLNAARILRAAAKEKVDEPVAPSGKRPKAAPAALPRDVRIVGSDQCPGRYPAGSHEYGPRDGLCSFCKCGRKAPM